MAAMNSFMKKPKALSFQVGPGWNLVGQFLM